MNLFEVIQDFKSNAILTLAYVYVKITFADLVKTEVITNSIVVMNICFTTGFVREIIVQVLFLEIST